MKVSQTFLECELLDKLFCGGLVSVVPQLIYPFDSYQNSYDSRLLLK